MALALKKNDFSAGFQIKPPQKAMDNQQSMPTFLEEKFTFSSWYSDEKFAPDGKLIYKRLIPCYRVHGQSELIPAVPIYPGGKSLFP